MTDAHIQLKLFAALTPFTPDNADQVPVVAGMTVRELIDQLAVPIAKCHLIFINGVKQSLDTRLDGGERVGIFPPVAGG